MKRAAFIAATSLFCIVLGFSGAGVNPYLAKPGETPVSVRIATCAVSGGFVHLYTAFDNALRNFVDRLQHSPEAIARAEAFKEEWLDDAAIAEMSGWLWDATRRAVSSYATRAEIAETPGPLARGISAFGGTLLENEKLLGELDELIIDRIVTVVEGHPQEVSDLIAETVARWDADATSRRMELAVGRDLQFVRINGTLVGGLVGLLIYAIPRLLK